MARKRGSAAERSLAKGAGEDHLLEPDPVSRSDKVITALYSG